MLCYSRKRGSLQLMYCDSGYSRCSDVHVCVSFCRAIDIKIFLFSSFKSKSKLLINNNYRSSGSLSLFQRILWFINVIHVAKYASCGWVAQLKYTQTCIHFDEFGVSKHFASVNGMVFQRINDASMRAFFSVWIAKFGNVDINQMFNWEKNDTTWTNLHNWSIDIYSKNHSNCICI